MPRVYGHHQTYSPFEPVASSYTGLDHTRDFNNFLSISKYLEDTRYVNLRKDNNILHISIRNKPSSHNKELIKKE